jgi:SAM-dependent methyltransferase
MKQLLDSLLVCPDTLIEVRRVEGGFANESTGAFYPVADGIPVMRRGPLRLKESVWGEEAADPDHFIWLRCQDELQMPEFVLGALGGMILEIVNRVTPRLGLTLDIDTGTGRLVRSLLESRALKSFVVATDISPHVLLGLTRLMKDEGQRVPAAVAVNPVRLPFRSAVFDTAMSLAGFSNIPSGRTALGEAARVLKPGGMLIFAHLMLLDPSGKGVAIAEDRGLGDLIDLARLDMALRTFDMRIVDLHEYSHGRWPENASNVVPASGDLFSLVLIEARKEQ